MMDERNTGWKRRTRKGGGAPDRPRETGDERNRHPGPGEQAGEGIGGVGGTLAGAGLGSLAGPVGTVIGGIAGAVGGWWAGEKVGRAVEDLHEHDDHYRAHWRRNRSEDVGFEDARVGYAVGHAAGHNPDYRGRPFEEIEPELRDHWADDRYGYDAMRPYVREGFRRTSARTR